jgi:hypothetical protein
VFKNYSSNMTSALKRNVKIGHDLVATLKRKAQIGHDLVATLQPQTNIGKVLVAKLKRKMMFMFLFMFSNHWAFCFLICLHVDRTSSGCHPFPKNMNMIVFFIETKTSCFRCLLTSLRTICFRY